MELWIGDEPAGAAAAAIARRLRRAVALRGAATMAVSGGSTAPPMLAALFAEPVDWPRVDCWQVDERVAPDGHVDRNAEQLADAPCRVHPMPVVASDRRAAARRYAGSLPDRIDVVHLGIGDDGHTASWPPTPHPDHDVPRSDRPVELVTEFHGRDRMTLTARVVNGAGSRIVLATGPAKAPIVERWLLGDPSIPIGRVRRSRTLVFLDPAAAGSLPL